MKIIDNFKQRRLPYIVNIIAHKEFLGMCLT